MRMIRVPLRLLALAAGLAFFTASTHAAPKTLNRFKGDFGGPHSASGTFIIYRGTNTGESTAKFRATDKNQAGRLEITGKDESTGRSYRVTITLNKDGKATTSAIVPGVVDIGGDGTWRLSQDRRQITLQLAADTAIGRIETTATLAILNRRLDLRSTSSSSGFFGSGSGRYDFSGRKQ